MFFQPGRSPEWRPGPRRRETLSLCYGVGFGAVTPNIPAGQIVQASNALTQPFVLKLGFGSTQVKVAYAGLAPGLVGLYQFNVIVPQSSGTGAVPLSFTLGGVSGTQQLFISLQ
jgi:uncharacterized protein (TIGR03437 family)